MVNVRICELKKKEDLKLATHHNMVKGRVKVSFLNGTWSHRVLEFKPESYYEDESEPITTGTRRTTSSTEPTSMTNALGSP